MLFSDAVSCLDYKASDICVYVVQIRKMLLKAESLSIRIRTWTGYFVRYKIVMDRTGIETGPSWLEAAA